MEEIFKMQNAKCIAFYLSGNFCISIYGIRRALRKYTNVGPLSFSLIPCRSVVTHFAVLRLATNSEEIFVSLGV